MDALPTVKHEKIKLVEINEYLTCPLCKGYFIDATTISECLHSFCRSCIIQFLQENSHCPICEVIINKAKPNIKLDKTLQDIVYKLVPELFLREMARRQRFYGQHPALAAKATPEERGEDTERTIFNPKDLISLSIEYMSDDSTPGAITVPAPLENNMKNSKNCDNNDSQMKRFLQCPGMCRIEVLKKFVQNKYNVNTVLFHIEVLYKRVPLPNHYTLIDIAYIYSWKRNEPMKFFFRIMEKSAAEKMENSDTIEQDIFVKPVKPVRNIERTKSNRSEFKKKITPVASPEKKIDENKSDVIINTDKIKDEIKNKLQDIGKGPVYTNITLNRSNNVEIITKVQKVSNKNGQPIGLNIIKQTVKKTNRLHEKINDKLTEKPTQITNGCKPDVRLKKEQNDIRIDKVIKKDVKIIVKKENKQEAKSKPDRDLSNISPDINIKSELNAENKIKLETDILFIKKEEFNQNLSNKENQSEPIEPEPTIKEEIEPEVPINEKNEESNVVIQTTVEKKEFDIDEEKSNFLKSIELTARTALQTIQGLKPPPDKSNQTTTSPKSTQKRKNSSPVKNDKKKPKKTKNSPIKLPTSSVDKIMLLAEKHKNGDLQSLFTSCKINIPSSLSITLKESSEDDRDRRNAASLKPVQNYIEILKLPDSNPTQLEKTDVDNRFKSKSAPNLPCKISVVSGKDQKQQLQTFQKMFEDSLKKIELNSKINLTPNNNHLKSNTPEESTQNNSTKRNLMEIASQLHKKTKLEAEKPAQKNDSLPKIPIPRLNIQRKNNNQLKFQQTIANLHSASLGLNYTVSVAQNSNKSSGGKIEAKVENSIKTPVKMDESVRVEEAQNLTKKEDKIEEHKSNGRITVPNIQNISNQPTNLVKNHSPKTNSTKPQAPIRQPNISPNISPRSNISPIPPHIASSRHKNSPEKPLINSGTSQNLQATSAFSPNHILEKYNIQNLAQLTANLNFNSGMFGMNHTSQLAALQQAMLLKQFELHNRQNWQLSNQYEKYIQNRLLSKEN